MNVVKKTTLTCLFAALMTAAFAQTTNRINFELKGYGSGTVKILGVYGDQNYLLDTARMTNGNVSFISKDSIPQGLYYVLLPDGKNFQILVANGENNFTIRTRLDNLILGIEAEGSLENQLLADGNRYQAALETKFNALTQQLQTTQPNTPQYVEIQQQQNALLAERDAKLAELKAKHPNSLYVNFKTGGQNPKLRMTYLPDGRLDSAKVMVNYRYDYWDGYNFSDSRLIRTPVFVNKLKRYILELTPQRADSVVASAEHVLSLAKVNDGIFKDCLNWILANYKPGQSKLMDGEDVYSFLVLKYMTADRFPEIEAKDLALTQQRAVEMRASLLGMKGQDVWGTDKNGVKKSLYDIKTRFKVVFIYNPECEHCQEQAPDLRRIYDSWKARGLEVFSIAANAKSVDEWQKFAKKYNVNWIDVIDSRLESKYHLKYYIDITPEVYVLDQDFRIIAKNLKTNQIEGVLIEHLAKNQ
jgi:peroxiredoxin